MFNVCRTNAAERQEAMEPIKAGNVAESVERVSRKRNKSGAVSAKMTPLAALFAAFRNAGLALPDKSDAEALLNRAVGLANAAEQSETRAAAYIARDGGSTFDSKATAENIVASLTVAYSAMRQGKIAKALRIVAVPNPAGGSPLYRVVCQLSVPRPTTSNAAQATQGALTF